MCVYVGVWVGGGANLSAPPPLGPCSDAYDASSNAVIKRLQMLWFECIIFKK